MRSLLRILNTKKETPAHIVWYKLFPKLREKPYVLSAFIENKKTGPQQLIDANLPDVTSDNGFAANPVNGGKSGLLNMPSNDPQLTPKMLARSYTATNSIPNSSEKVNTENGIAEEVAKTVRNKAFASRSGMAAQSILNKTKAGETPADSEINELVYAAINDRELVQRAIEHGMAQNNDSQAFAVASRLEKSLQRINPFLSRILRN